MIVISSHSCQVNLGLTPCPSHSCLHSVAQLSELCLGHHLGNESILNGTPSFPGWSPTELPNGQLHSSKSCIWLPLQSLRVDPACTLFLFYKFVAYAGDLDAFSKRPRSALLLPQDSSRPNAQLRQLQFRSWCMKCIESINPPVFLATSPCAGLRMTKDFSLWAGISMKWEMDKCSVLCFAVSTATECNGPSAVADPRNCFVPMQIPGILFGGEGDCGVCKFDFPMVSLYCQSTHNLYNNFCSVRSELRC